MNFKVLISFLLYWVCLTISEPARAALFQVKTESGTHTTSSGDSLRYNLFIPQRANGKTQPPWPIVILCHGYTRTLYNMYYNAYYMAQRGIIVITPEVISITGEEMQQQNVANTVDFVSWMLARNDTPGNSLYQIVNPMKIGLAG